MRHSRDVDWGRFQVETSHARSALNTGETPGITYKQ